MKKYKTIDLLHAVYNGKEFKCKFKNVVSGQVIQQGLYIEDCTDQSKHFFIDNKTNFQPDTRNLKTFEKWLKEEWEEVQELVTFDEARKSGKRFKHIYWFGYFVLKDIMRQLSYLNDDTEIQKLLDSKEWLIEEDI